MTNENLNNVAAACFKHVPLSTDELRELAMPVAPHLDEEPHTPPPMKLDRAALEARVAYIEERDKEHVYADSVLLPCMRKPKCEHEGLVLIRSKRELDDYFNGRTICRKCFADMLEALPADMRERRESLYRDAFAASWAAGIASKSTPPATVAELKRKADELYAQLDRFEDAWIYAPATGDNPPANAEQEELPF